MIRFLVYLLAVAALIAGALLLSVNRNWLEAIPSFAWPSLLLLFFTTTFIYSYLYKAKDSGFFTQFYLLSMIIKLLAYVGYCYFMIVEDKSHVRGNVVFFMIVYFIFTAIEIGFLYQKLMEKPKA